uniref:Uncharacterized protein n=1 Tax=Streptomyces sp. NBC_00093 TaxID=2975649 RepID=A0AAU1ZR67_9ACTN
MPSSTPRTRATRTASEAYSSEGRAPWISLLRVSRPIWSVPSQ